MQEEVSATKAVRRSLTSQWKSSEEDDPEVTTLLTWAPPSIGDLYRSSDEDDEVIWAPLPCKPKRVANLRTGPPAKIAKNVSSSRMISSIEVNEHNHYTNTKRTSMPLFGGLPPSKTRSIVDVLHDEVAAYRLIETNRSIELDRINNVPTPPPHAARLTKSLGRDYFADFYGAPLVPLTVVVEPVLTVAPAVEPSLTVAPAVEPVPADPGPVLTVVLVEEPLLVVIAEPVLQTDGRGKRFKKINTKYV
jgi:hypothetical protein